MDLNERYSNFIDKVIKNTVEGYPSITGVVVILISLTIGFSYGPALEWQIGLSLLSVILCILVPIILVGIGFALISIFSGLAGEISKIKSNIRDKEKQDIRIHSLTPEQKKFLKMLYDDNDFLSIIGSEQKTIVVEYIEEDYSTYNDIIQHELNSLREQYISYQKVYGK